ncbi:DUF4368 domain-containing protein [Mediterraneibacter glycyrrhizinilyticus]|nr:DUF4368 domain-containing protein [Mediterraneibacter glycyrrhizinilyticus]MDN0061605.1 DUF4368 domain-containing protein [Mediterraneibacter glycyrrhizinilyticus]
MDAQEVMHMTDYSKITALYSRLSVGDEDRDGGESNSIQNQKIFLENYARGQHLTNIRHYIDDDESGRFFDRSAYSRMMDDVENGKIGVCIMKDLTRWGRDYLQVGNKLYEDNALGTIPQDRYEQMSQKYSEEYYTLKTELATLQEQLSAYENAGGRAQKFLKLTERYAAFTDLTPAILNEFISRIEVHERDKKRAKQAVQHIGIYFNYIGRFENEVTQLAEPTEQEVRQMREEIEEAQKEKSRAYHRQYSREYRARNLEKQREYDRMKAREYRARRKAQAAAAAPAQ